MSDQKSEFRPELVIRTGEDFMVIDAMEKFGGSFVKALGRAMRLADRHNFIKLREAFSKYWKDYSDPKWRK